MRIGIFRRSTRIDGPRTSFDSVFELLEFVLDFRNSSAKVSLVRNKGKYALLFTRRKDGSIMQGDLPRWAHREQGFGYCSVALHLAFICRQRVQERAPRTGRLSQLGVSGLVGSGDIGRNYSGTLSSSAVNRICVYETQRSIEMRCNGFGSAR
jgi:hypothetical protein